MYESMVELINDRDVPIEVIFEPYGTVYEVPPFTLFRVLSQGEAEGELILDRSGDMPVVYAWPTSTSKVFIGDQLYDDCTTPFPGLPEGMSTKEFIKMFFGGPGEPRSG